MKDTILTELGIPKDREELRAIVDDYGKSGDFLVKLRDFLEGKGFFTDFPQLDETVLRYLAKMRVVRAIVYGAEISLGVFQNRERFWGRYQDIMGWIPNVDDDCEDLDVNHSHEQAMEEVLNSYFDKKRRNL